MFYLTTHSTHFIYERERNVLFNDALNTFYLRLCGVRHTVKNHSDWEREREETRCRHMSYSFRLTARVILNAPSHRQDSTYHGLLLHWLEREIKLYNTQLQTTPTFRLTISVLQRHNEQNIGF